MALLPGTYAVFNPTEGKIPVKLFEADAPITIKNFIELAEGGKHRRLVAPRARWRPRCGVFELEGPMHAQPAHTPGSGR